MEKINFQDLPSTSTPVNATNLNAVQTNVETEFTNYYTQTAADAKFYDKTEINYIGENDDLDNYLTTGCYTNGGQNPAHNPVGSAFVGLLVVFKSYYAAQLLITSDYYYNVYVRFYGGNSWGDWRTLI